MRDAKTDVLQGTLDLLVLKTLETMGPMHGWGIARRIEQVSEDALSMNQGTLYPALLRLEQRGWINSQWGPYANFPRHTGRPAEARRQIDRCLEIDPLAPLELGNPLCCTWKRARQRRPSRWRPA